MNEIELQITEILQATLLSVQGMDSIRIYESFPHDSATIGLQLSNFLKKKLIKLKEEKNEFSRRT